jgi:hypothetical protein
MMMETTPPPEEAAVSEYISRAYGESGLTDDERRIIMLITLRHVADRLGISDAEAATVLDGYAETGDSHIMGNQREVSMVVDGVELVRFSRAWLRAVADRGDPVMN